MGQDSLIVNPGRLQILTALAADGRQEFVRLRQQTQMTDGNLASHAKRLTAAGLILVDKRFERGKPVTRFTLTPAGRLALEEHVQRLTHALSVGGKKSAITPETTSPIPESPAVAAASDEEWVD